MIDPISALDGLQKAIGMVKKAQAVANDIGGLSVMVGRLFDAESQATKAMVSAKRSGDKSNFALAMQIENALMNTAKMKNELQLIYMQTGNIDTWNKIKERAAQMDLEDAKMAKAAKDEEKKRKQKEQEQLEMSLLIGGIAFVLLLVGIGINELMDFCHTTHRCGR